MTVQRVKGWMLSVLMFQHNDGPIIMLGGIIGKGKDSPIQWSIYDRILWNEQIYSKMNGTIFIGWFIPSGKGRRDVKIARLVITSNANRCARFIDGLKDAGRQLGFMILRRVTA